MKQKLKLKKYVGYSENAVRIQIYCALITYTLMGLLNNEAKIAKTLSEAAIILAHTLFQHPDTDRLLTTDEKTESLKWRLGSGTCSYAKFLPDTSDAHAWEHIRV